MIDQPRYFHRKRSIRSYESFCLRCFFTVGSRASEAELRIDEEQHVCNAPSLPPVSSRDQMRALDIVDVELIKDCGVVITFSDGTVARYTPEELAGLRPHRESIANLEPLLRR